MQAIRRTKRMQRVLLGAGLVLALYAVLVYRPLSHRATEQHKPLLNLWTQLAGIQLSMSGTTDASLSKIDRALQTVQKAQDDLHRARVALTDRIRLDTNLVQHITEPFQLIEFQNQRQLVIEQLWNVAGQKKVALEAPIIDGFPEYTFERREPEMLWLQLNLVEHALSSAISCGVSRIQSVVSPLPRIHQSSDEIVPNLVEVSTEIELTGSATSVQDFLQSLPLRAAELKERGLPESLETKPVMLLDRVFLRKVSKEKLDEVYLKVTVCSFAYARPF